MALNPLPLANWFQSRPAWVREAAALIVHRGRLEPDDYSRLLACCQGEGTGPATSNDTKPLEQVFASTPRKPRVRLKSISDVKGIDALTDKLPLEFAPEGLTVVYGGTGVGKSGYIRILNNLCGSKNSRELQGNVFRKSEPRSCTVSFIVGEAPNETVHTVGWKPSDGLIDPLTAVEIYDAEAGHVYVNEENEATFEPWVLSFFQNLIDACTRMDTMLKDKIAALPSRKPLFPAAQAGSAAGTWYSKLQARTPGTQILEWCTWKQADQLELEGLQRRLIERSPADQAKALRLRKAAIDRIIRELRAIQAALSEGQLAVLFQAKDKAKIKTKAASEDAAKVFAQTPLPGIGQESWKLLWEQARAYSEKVAYIGKSFPNVETNAVCVLCQQPLQKDGRSRLLSFESFVRGKLEEEAKTAEAEVAQLLAAVPKIPSLEQFEERLLAVGASDENFCERLEVFRDQAEKRTEALLADVPPGELPKLEDLQKSVALEELCATLETKAKEFDADASKTDKAALNARLRELEGRKWLAEQRAGVEAEVERLQEIEKLEEARKLANTTVFSKKKGELARQLVTESFIQRFNAELKALNASRLRVELTQSRTEKGHVFHEIQLKNLTITARPADILSEGERRIISLAAFISDVEGLERDAPVVFDDPITSLDQDFEEHVAARITSLAKKRQVIVFTHRLSLFTLLDDTASREDVDLRTLSLNRQGDETGIPSEAPFGALKPDRAIARLLNDRLTRAERAFTDGRKEDYEIQAKAICSEFRIVLERLVEDVLLNQVVRRFRRSVQTMNRIKELSRISLEDCLLIDDLMTKYSRYEHSQPIEAPVEPPEPKELSSDLTCIQSWIKEFSKRPLTPSPISIAGEAV